LFLKIEQQGGFDESVPRGKEKRGEREGKKQKNERTIEKRMSGGELAWGRGY